MSNPVNEKNEDGMGIARISCIECDFTMIGLWEGLHCDRALKLHPHVTQTRLITKKYLQDIEIGDELPFAAVQSPSNPQASTPGAQGGK